MEDMFSLGNVGLWKYVTNSSWAPTGEVGELFITKILGTIILKLKYKDIVYAVSKTQMKDILEYQPRKVDISSTLTALMN